MRFNYEAFAIVDYDLFVNVNMYLKATVVGTKTKRILIKY